MSDDPIQRALWREFNADHGECHYCGGRRFKSADQWRRHLDTEHEGFIRQENLRQVLAAAGAEDRPGPRGGVCATP